MKISSSNKLKVAVTGGIGTGKSTFCRFLEEMGFKVIHADPLAKEIMNNNPLVKSKLTKEFGNEVYSNGTLNTKLFADKIFSKSELVAKVNSIVHPLVIDEIKRLIDEHLIKQDIIFVEAALIYEANMENMFDYVVVIASDENIAIERGMKRDNSSQEEIKKRMLYQIPLQEKIEAADIVFMNNGTLEELKSKAKLLPILLMQKTIN